MVRKPLVLIIRDGWGYREDAEHNALKEAGTPFTDAFMNAYPNTLLSASGEAVGLPEGYQGNSEVGHITIGSGRIIMQSLARINKAINNGSFFKITAFLDVINHCKEKDTTLHLMGLIQREGVHAHLNHLFALLDLCDQQGFHDVKIHAITDGRDAPVMLSVKYLQELDDKITTLGFGEVVSVSGRYYAMDRDKRWERTRLFYDAVVHAQAEGTFEHAIDQVRACHAERETDEFIKPRVKKTFTGIKENDGVIFFNFRTDRPRQFTQAMMEDSFEGFERVRVPVHFVAMTRYYHPMNAAIAFSDQDVAHIFGEIISEAGLTQLRISETEKYAHVTFFFNAEREEPYPGEERILIPSPKVATYDLQPEMSAPEITRQLVAALDKDKFDVVIANIVNGDMVGHTGDRTACHKAVRAVDDALKKIVDAVLAHGGTALVFADHGNIEDQTTDWRTSHTMNKIPFMLISADEALKHVSLKRGKGLQDIAPTALALLGLNKPAEMSGESLIE